MNDDHGPEEAGALSRMLRSWPVQAPLPPRFQEEVWRRVGRAEESQVWRGFGQWWKALVQRPALVVGYLGLFLALGMSAGYWSAAHYTARTEQAWRAAYLQSVTPHGLDSASH